MTELRRDDGRTLAFDDPGGDGHPVVLFHGAPGSRGFRPAFGAAAGARVITFDRPGYGDSSPLDGRSVLDTAVDVAALLDTRGLDRVALVGWSGGCPFAVAAAFALGAERVASLALVSGPGPLDEVPGAWAALGARRGPTAEMARREPHRSVRAITRHMQPAIAAPESFLGTGRGPDGDLLRDPEHRVMLTAQIDAALRQGAAGIAADLVAMWQPWGFALAEVAVPTRVFHASLDRHNESDCRTYAARIPAASLTTWPDAGHLGILDHWPEVLAAGRAPRAAH